MATAKTPIEIEHLCSACAHADGWPSRLYLPDSDFAPFRPYPDDVMQPRGRDIDGIENLAADTVQPQPSGSVSLAEGDLPMGDEAA